MQTNANFPSFSAPADSSSQQTAPASDAGGDNPFADNPFGGSSDSGSTFEVKAFKPKGVIGLEDDDDKGGFDQLAAGKSKKKKNDRAAMKQEIAKKKEEELASKPTKGKNSDFFILDYDPTSNDDPYGNCRVPNQEQELFIYTHYPTFSQRTQMIIKLYELYHFAKAEEDSEEAYKRAKK